MADKEQRARQAAKHISLMKGVFASEIAACADSAQIFEDGQGRELPIAEGRFEKTKTLVTTDFATKALYATKDKAVVIDPGAFTRPGGNYEGGAFGPEQVLCADSILYPVLCNLKESFYDKNRGWESGLLFTDRAVYLSDVTFNRNGSLSKADIVVISPPNRSRALENNRSPEGCDQALGFRIEAMLRVAASGGADTLVCPAFGCGAQGNPDAQVAGLIKDWLDAHPGVFETVVFTVPRSSFNAFYAVFGADGEADAGTGAGATGERAGGRAGEVSDGAGASADADADDEDAWRDVDLPEGITIG